MDCKYIKQNDIHEKYLFDRLNETDKSEYLSHLKKCAECQSNLEVEKEMIASIRHIGKNEMKSEIAKQAAAIKSKEIKISWDMILKVAAIFFFLVITPALVFYYQTIETPKISETIDFDEILGKQKEIESVEEEKSEYKKPEITESKRKKEESISDAIKSERYLESAGGAAAEPTLRSVKISKSSPKIDKLEKIQLDDIISGEEFVLESVQPIPTAPKSDIPELEKFQKPKFAQIKDHEYFRAKSVSRKTMTAPSPAHIYDKSKTEQYSLSESVSAGKEIAREKLAKNEIYRLDYYINNEKIAVNLVPLYEKSEYYFQEVFPDSFPVIIKKRNTVDLTMDWFINEKIRNLNPYNISVYLSESNFFYVRILNEIFYKIDLKSDSTKAKVIH